jgi:hypothetical protein
VGLLDGLIADVPGLNAAVLVRFLRATHAMAAMSRIAATATTTIKTMVLVVMSTPWVVDSHRLELSCGCFNWVAARCSRSPWG